MDTSKARILITCIGTLPTIAIEVELIDIVLEVQCIGVGKLQLILRLYVLYVVKGIMNYERSIFQCETLEQQQS
jgi:hypothetical protein